MRRYRLIGAGGVICLMLLASALLARPGVVLTQDGNRFEGDVVENKDKGTVDITPPGGQTITVNHANVSSITYSDEIDKAVRQKLAKLDRNDLAGHLDLARYAIDHHSYDTAREVLEDARRIDPRNRQVNDMLDSVNQQIRARGPTTAESVATTQPAATQETVARPPDAPQDSSGVTRMVTPEEINRIREVELGKNDTNVRVHIDPDAKKKFLSFTGMSNSEFARMAPVQQAYMILDQGKRDMRDGVHILSDPPPLLSFHKDVIRALISGCATSKCHGSHSAGSFYLYPQAENEAAIYTDFVILQKYARTINGRRYQFIDRETPDQSLLLQYVLPPDFAEIPHPGKTSYKGIVHSRNDQHYKQIYNWISTQLPLPAPDYGFIDLSAPPTTKPAAAAQ